QPFEHRDVLIWQLGVAIDIGVCKPGKNLVIAGIRKPHRIGNLRFAVLVLVTKDLPLLGNLWPENTHRRTAPFLSRLSPIGLLGTLDTLHPRYPLMQKQFLCTRKRLLPTQAVGSNLDDVFGHSFLRGANAKSKAKKPYRCEQNP